MANILKQKIKYTRRQITNDGSGLVTLFLPSAPAHLPAVGDTLLISHTNLPTNSGIENVVNTKQTNMFTATFYSYEANRTATDINDGYNYFMVVKYTDTSLASNLGAGSCSGYLEYEVTPSTYEIMKPIENAVIVQENVPFDGADGLKSLSGSTATTGSTNPDIFPMLYVERGDSNTVFSNLFKAFNLPVTTDEINEFRQSTLGTLTSVTAPYPTDSVIVGGQHYTWASGGTGNVVHPDTGYTGTYYGTVYEKLCPLSGGTTYNGVLIIEIPSTKYGEIIDGKSIKMEIPSGGTSGSSYTIYSAYQTNDDLFETTGLDTFLSEHSVMSHRFGSTPDLDGGATEINSSYESNVVLLFSDDIAPPSGNTITSWATGHDEVIDGEKVYYENAAVNKAMYDLHDDKDGCVGIAYLDKGFIVITDPTIVDDVYSNMISGSTAVVYGASGHTSLIENVDDNGDIDLDDTQFLFKDEGYTATLQYLSYNTEKSLNIVCLASTDEFFRTTNSTAKELFGLEATEDYADFKTSSNNLYPISITELGLHDEDGNLLAICKPTQPVDKYWYDVVSFNIRIRL